MSCNCLDEIREKLNNHPQYCGASLKTSTSINLRTGDEVEKAGSLEFNYKTKNKKGELSKKTISSWLSFTYCPFCGTKY